MLKQYNDSYAFADVNCRPRYKFNGKFSFFETVDDIEALVRNKIMNHKSAFNSEE